VAWVDAQPLFLAYFIIDSKRVPSVPPDSRAGGGAPAMESRLSTLATSGFGVWTSL